VVTPATALVTGGYHTEGLAVAVSNKLIPMIIEVTPVKERVMRLIIRHFLGVTSLVSIYAPTEASDLCHARVRGRSVPQTRYSLGLGGF